MNAERRILELHTLNFYRRNDDAYQKLQTTYKHVIVIFSVCVNTSTKRMDVLYTRS